MNKVLIAITFSAVFVALPAAAQPYLGGGFGYARTDTSHTSYKLLAGFQSTQNFGGEVAYNNFGGYRGGKASSWSAALIGTLPLDKNWDIFAKLGATENHTTATGSARKSEVLLGAGVGYNYTQNIGVRFEYEDFGKSPTDINGNRVKIRNWSLNAKYSF